MVDFETLNSIFTYEMPNLFVKHLNESACSLSIYDMLDSLEDTYELHNVEPPGLLVKNIGSILRPFIENNIMVLVVDPKSACPVDIESVLDPNTPLALPDKLTPMEKDLLNHAFLVVLDSDFSKFNAICKTTLDSVKSATVH